MLFIVHLRFFGLSDGSVLKSGGHVGKNDGDVGNFDVHVGKITFHVGITPKPSLRTVHLIREWTVFVYTNMESVS